jgi:hypothetical protein
MMPACGKILGLKREGALEDLKAAHEIAGSEPFTTYDLRHLPGRVNTNYLVNRGMIRIADPKKKTVRCPDRAYRKQWVITERAIRLLEREECQM